MFKQFSGCFRVGFFLIILIWTCSFGRDNCFYQCVAIVGIHIGFLSFPYKLPTQGFWTLNTRRNSLKQNDTIILHIHTPAFRFHFHDCKHEKLELKVMLMVLKSSLDCHKYSCSCGHFTSNSIMVTQLEKTPKLYSLFILLIWLHFTSLWCNDILVIVIESLIQWWYDIPLSLIKFLGAMVS